jgi:hypothetical protein
VPHRGLVGSSVVKLTTKPVIGTLASKICSPLLLAPNMNPWSTDQGSSDAGSAGHAEHEPGSRSWIRQVPSLPGRSLHAPPTISACASSGPIPPEASMIEDKMSTVLYTEDLGSTHPHSPNREAVSCQGTEQEFFRTRRNRQDLFRRKVR